LLADVTYIRYLEADAVGAVVVVVVVVVEAPYR